MENQSPHTQSVISLMPEEYKTLEQNFLLQESPEQIWRFLGDEKIVLGLLQESIPHLKKHFPNTKIYLRLLEDDESGDERIIVDIRHNMDYNESRARNKSFAREWFLEKLEIADRKLNFLLYP